MEAEHRARVSLLNPIHFLALGFGSGLSPFMPGTAGSLAAIPLVFGLAFFNQCFFLVIAILTAVIGIYICGKTAGDLGEHDHGAIVWDEIAGMLLTFLFVPVSITTVVIGFLLFRIFDIAKPWPISLADKKVHGGLGIMLDDVIAGLLSCGCLHLALHLGWL
jgi:phosphatidylglycerophosphatase A